MPKFPIDLTDQYQAAIGAEIRYGQGRAEYTCPRCGNKELRAGRFVLVCEEQRSYRGEEHRLPEICGAPLVDLDFPCYAEMVWTPTQAATDLLGENFIVDVGNGPQKLSSLSEVRSLERDSLRRAANGEGAPLNFRALSMNRSNRDVNSLRNTSYETNRQVPVNTRTQSGQEIRARVRCETE